MTDPSPHERLKSAGREASDAVWRVAKEGSLSGSMVIAVVYAFFVFRIVVWRIIAPIIGIFWMFGVLK